MIAVAFLWEREESEYYDSGLFKNVWYMILHFLTFWNTYKELTSANSNPAPTTEYKYNAK